MTPLAVLLIALVAEDPTTLRGAPDDAAPAQATLYRGDWLEVRGEVPGFLKVWDHRHERPGYVRKARVRVHKLDEAAAPELRVVVHFLRDANGFESLGIGYAALYLRVASVQRGQLEWGEVLGALGAMADRLARRAGGVAGASATAARAPESVLVGQLGVIESYGIRLRRFEQPASPSFAASANAPLRTRTVVCYDGDAFARVLAMMAAAAEERAAAALALTRRGCLDPATSAAERRTWNEARLTILGEADPARPAFSHLPRGLAHQLRLRTAEALTERAHTAAAAGQLAPATAAATEARRLLALVDRGELAPEDQPAYEESALRVAAVVALAEVPAAGPRSTRRNSVEVELAQGRPGETCVRLWPADRKPVSAPPLIQRCTFGVVFPASVRMADGGRAVAVAVAPVAGWTEQWIFRAGSHPDEAIWRAEVIPPAAGQPGDDIGYVEVAGFAPDGRQVLVVREFLVGGRRGKRFEQLGPDGVVLHWAPSPQRLGAFARWASPAWRRVTLSLR
jgi:hypothetical protein